ncbi:MAG: response regulator transcription factor [Desulfobacterota bacterium]|nr:response regulator transcription factor [Thermodesulfobacteriota bacterium]MDW8001494.1 response regulator transcription factor [Deltaproteobacteria bacterium]
MRKIKILIVDDHTMVRDGIKSLLSLCADLQVVGEAENGIEAQKKTQELEPDIILMDISMPGIDGIETTRRIISRFRGTKVIMLTQYEGKDELLDSIRAGAKGFVSKKAASTELVQAIRAVYTGGAYFSPSVAKLLIEDYRDKRLEKTPYETLTERETQILKLIGEGYSDKEIAQILFISPRTVETHKAKIMEKLHLKKKVELIKYAIKKGIVKV